MGLYINPGNEGFLTVRRSRYVDKSGMIALINDRMDTKEKLFCICRPRRFGKSTAAQMLAAYYDRSCDSSALFSDLAIASDPGYHKHLNQYNVLYLDITNFIGIYGLPDLLASIQREISREILKEFPGVPGIEEAGSASTLLDYAVAQSGKKFVAILDEWDAPIRDDSATKEQQKAYLQFLRSFFKSGNVTDRVFAAAYMTGILPIKKDGSQSAVSEFEEYTMLNPKSFAPFVGFTEEEVGVLCEKYDGDFEEMKRWYDGYSLRGFASIYNPNSVMKALRNRSYESYWQQSSSAKNLLDYVNLDYAGLSKAVLDLLGDKVVAVQIGDFENDLRSVRSRDDVLTLLIHFGYLCYDQDAGTVRIPNEEIKMEFGRTVRNMTHTDTIRRVQESDQLIEDTADMREEAVAAAIEKVHREEFSPRLYNNEQALRSVVKLAYFAYRDKYQLMEELPGGNGYADLVFLPKPGNGYPALVVELKWDQGASGAIRQIKERRYPEALRNCGAEILLVGISYDKADPAKRHHCRIEQWEV